MEQLTPEQIELLSSVGAVWIIACLGAMLVLMVVSAALMNVSLGIVGNRKPGVLACIGWMWGMGFVNMVVSGGLSIALGPAGAILAVPAGIFVVSYMLAQAGDCSILRGFVAYILNAFLTVGVVMILILVLIIPLSMLGNREELKDVFEKVAAAQEKRAEDMDSFPDVFTNQSGTRRDDESISPVSLSGRQRRRAESGQLPSREPSPGDRVKTHGADSSRSIERAADGTSLNPFFTE